MRALINIQSFLIGSSVFLCIFVWFYGDYSCLRVWNCLFIEYISLVLKAKVFFVLAFSVHFFIKRKEENGIEAELNNSIFFWPS